MKTTALWALLLFIIIVYYYYYIGRSSAAITDVEIRPEIETGQEPEIGNPAEIQVSMSAICEGGSGAH